MLKLRSYLNNKGKTGKNVNKGCGSSIEEKGRDLKIKKIQCIVFEDYLGKDFKTGGIPENSQLSDLHF